MRLTGIVGHRYWIAVVFFLLAAAPGFWVPVLSNVLKARGWETTITWAFLLPPAAGIISPLILGARADQRYRADRILGLMLGGGAIFLYLAFWFLENGDSPAGFLFFLGINSLVSAPAWSLLMTVAFANLSDSERQFGSYRVWGTLGWMAAGWSVSFLKLDDSASSGQLASGIRLFAGAACFFLPPTPPRGEREFGWRSALGLSSLRVLKERDQAVYFVTVFLFTVPLSAFYMHTPPFLNDLGWSRVAAAMSIGQISEVIALLGLGIVLVRCRLKWVLLAAIASGVVRYVLYASGSLTQSATLVLAGVALHGVCWTFFFESGRVFVDRRVPVTMRAQTQALMTLVSGGLGGVAGTLVVGGLHHWLVVVEGAPGWTVYWSVLAVMCLACGVGFAIGYQGLASARRAEGTPSP